ncbi:MAG: glycoside hydrolase family 3 protein [Beijerinckiaceae bacterium]
MTGFTRRAMLFFPAAVAAPFVSRAHAAVDDRSIAEMLVLGFHGESAKTPGAQNLARHVAAGRVGGVCFLGHNTKSRGGIEGLARLFQSAGKSSVPFVSVDQEGGAVQRLGKRNGYKPFPAAQAVAARQSTAEAQSIYAGMARQLKAAGFNLNLAPVVDLGFEPRNPVVTRWGRAFSADGAKTAAYAGAFVRGHRSAGVLTSVKHFPGHGSTLVDSHARPVNLTSTWREDELTPFRILTQQGLIDIVMSGHLSHARLTGGLPATLSPKAVELLRQGVGFNGAVMTDDLDMKAIRSSYSLMDAIIRAIAAGHDLILLSNSLQPDLNLPQKVIAAVKDAVADGRIPARHIEAAAQRVAQLKARIA